MMRSIQGGLYPPERSTGELVETPRRRMPGEDYATTSLREISSWIAIYSELSAVLKMIASRIADNGLQGAEARHHLDWVEERLASWRSRHAELAGLVINRPANSLVYMGQNIKLTRREADLLDFMLKHPGSTFTAKQLSSRAWQNPWLSDGQVRTYITRLRHRLSKIGLGGAILVERNRGYAVAAPHSERNAT
jgi:DNA-binding response OmpR family regulator